jgi:hypothetical protein
MRFALCGGDTCDEWMGDRDGKVDNIWSTGREIGGISGVHVPRR